MPGLKKFEATERKIAQAENVLLEHGKYVPVDWEEDDMYHREEHAKGADNMPTKLHIKRHIEQEERKARQKMENLETESSMIY